MNRTIYYEAQEEAMAPGISGEWPKVINPKEIKHGRLKRVNLNRIKAVLMREVKVVIDDTHPNSAKLLEVLARGFDLAALADEAGERN